VVLGHDFEPGFRIKLHIKDLDNTLDTGHGVEAPLPLTAAVREMMTVLAGRGFGGEDHSSLLRVYETLAQITLSSGAATHE